MESHTDPHSSPIEKWLGWTLLILAVLWALANLHRGRGAAWDEWEFLRATDWVRQGKVPYRDFWEHHAPLQWYLMAPIEALAPRSGNTPLLWLRWAQVPLWAAGLAALHHGMKDILDARVRRIFLGMLLATPFYTFLALEYRVDTLSTLLVLAAALSHGKAFRSRGWALATGALWTLAALANLRMGPMALVGLLLALVLDPGERRWRLNGHGLALGAGALIPPLVWGCLLLGTHSLGEAYLRLISDNAAVSAMFPKGSGRILETLAPLVTGFDLPGLLLMLAGVAGLVLAVLELKKPGPVQALALLQIANLLFIYKMPVHYPYHFQTTLILMVPLAAHGLSWTARRTPDFRLWPRFLLTVLAVQLGWNAWSFATTHPGEDWAYQDTILREAEGATRPGQKVLDACGPALVREPAYRYWFIPLLVRYLNVSGRMERYTPDLAIQDPPGAVIYDLRLRNWLSENPPLLLHTLSHYLPDYPNLWLPGMSWVVSPHGPRARWVVPASGEFRVLVSPGLALHPWFQAPLSLGMPGSVTGPQFTLNTATFPCQGMERLAWHVNGTPLRAEGAFLHLRQGEVLEASLPDGDPLGVMIVPASRTLLFRCPPGTPDYDVLNFYKAP